MTKEEHAKVLAALKRVSLLSAMPKSVAEEVAACIAIMRKEPQGWMPIETAPKDGRPILLFGDCRVTSGNWSAPSETPRIIYQDGFAPDTEWDEWEPYWESWDGGFTEEHPPTHWMPLPPPPALLEKAR